MIFWFNHLYSQLYRGAVSLKCIVREVFAMTMAKTQVRRRVSYSDFNIILLYFYAVLLILFLL